MFKTKAAQCQNAGRRASPVLLATLLVLSGSLAAQPKPSSQSPTQGPAVEKVKTAVSQTYKVGKGDVLRTLFFTGELQAERSFTINAPRLRGSFSAMVAYLAPEGEAIKQGDRLVEFDTSSLQSQRSEIERRVAEAKLKIDKQKADLEAQRCDYQNSVEQAQFGVKRAQLYAKIPKELQPSNTYQQYQVSLQKAQLDLQKAKEQLANFEASYPSQLRLTQISLEQAQLDLKRNDSDLELLSIKAPQEGIVIYGDNWASNRKIQIGDNIFPGMTVVLLPDLSTMQVVAYVYDTELSSLMRNMRCGFRLDAVPSLRFEGEVVAWDNVASRKGFATQQKVFKARIKPDKLDLATMKPGMTTHIELPVKLVSGVPVVSRECIGLNAQREQYVVKRIDDKTVSRQKVEVGAIGDRVVEVRSGVNVGDELIPVQLIGGGGL